MGWGTRITLGFGAALLIAACGNKGGGGSSSSSAQASTPGCASDKDCKGDRVCEGGKCVDAGGKKDPGGPSSASGPTASDPVVVMDGLATMMCACKDKDCGAKVAKEMTDWLEQHKNDKADKETLGKLEAASKKATDCEAKLGAAASADSSGIPECDAYLRKLVDCGMMKPADIEPLRAGYKRAVEAGPAIVATTAKTCAEATGSLPCINTSMGGPSCTKAAACCRAITNDPEADAKLNVRMGTATKADTLAACDQLEKAPGTACDASLSSTRDLIKQRLTPAQQARISSACE